MDQCESSDNASNKQLSCKAEVRCHKIVEVAYRLFLDSGYEKVSMNDIVKVAGGSLATLYKHFGNKEQLLIYVLDKKGEEVFGDWERQSVNYEGPIEEFLMHTGKFFLDLITEDDAVLFHRLIVSVGYLNDAKLGEMIMQTIMDHPTKIVADYLDKEKQKGSIDVQDTRLCAEQFLYALKDPFLLPRLLGVNLEITDATREKALKQIVSIFYKGIIRSR